MFKPDMLYNFYTCVNQLGQPVCPTRSCSGRERISQHEVKCNCSLVRYNVGASSRVIQVISSLSSVSKDLSVMAPPLPTTNQTAAYQAMRGQSRPTNIALDVFFRCRHQKVEQQA